MAELSNEKEKALDFLLEHVNTEIFSYEQQERDLGRLDYSLCSDDDEKSLITKEKVEKFKKSIQKCNPVIAGFLNALISPDPLNIEFEEKREVITINFLQEHYYELIEVLSKIDLNEIERYKFKSVIENLGFKYKLLKEFIQGVCDINSLLLYKSFIDIPKDEDLNYENVINKLNNAFFRLEAFMNGTTSNYKHFDFNTAFTELFYLTKKPEYYTFENCKLIGEYWQLTAQISIDFDKSDFTNIAAYKNKAFCNDCNRIISIHWDRLEEFKEFQTQDEIDEQTKKKTVSNIIKSNTTIPKSGVENKTVQIIKPSVEENPYPRIFKNHKAFIFFTKLVEEFGTKKDPMANYSFVYHRMKRDELIYDDFQQLQFTYFLINFNINIDRIKRLEDIGKIAYRESIYSKVK